MNKFIRLLMQLLYTPKCIFCGKVLTADADIEICKDCLEVAPFRKESVIRQRESGRSGGCEYVVCLFDYSGFVKSSIVRFKFFDRPGYHRALARLLSERIKKAAGGTGFDMVMSVPLHKSRRRSRGYNQAELLSRYIGRTLGVPDRSRLVKRLRATGSQSLLNRGARRENVRGAFGVTGADLLAGKRILLVDDVYTTGSTLNECSAVLKAAGAISVTGAVVASGAGKAGPASGLHI